MFAEAPRPWVEEIKSRTRRVRTPEGAAKYGQPIGSIIRNDPNVPLDLGNVAREASRAVGGGYASSSGPRTTREPKPKPVKMPTRSDIYRLTVNDVKSDGYSYWIDGFKDVQVKRRGGAITVTHEGKVTWNKEVQSVSGPDYAARKMAVQAVQYHYGDKDWQRSTWKNTDNFMDYWNGIYGKDYVLPDDESAFEWYDGGIQKRWGMVLEHAEELGVVISDQQGDMDIDVAEMLVNMHAAYEEMYPGFSNVQKYYGIGKEAPGAIAYNYPMAHVTNGIFGGMPTSEHGDVPQDYKGGSLNLTPRYFGDGIWNTRGKAEINEQKNLARLANWTVQVDRRDDTTLSQASWFAMQTFHHETGHTLGYIVLGGLTRNTDREYSDWSRKAMADLFMEYGIIEPEHHPDIAEPLPQGANAVYAAKHLPSEVNTYALSQHVSAYGTSNWHEMMAEAWSEYMLSDNPSAFSYDLAQIMEQALLEYLGSIDA